MEDHSTYILKLRLHNQLLACGKLAGPAEVVSYMGAVQAQESRYSKWALALRSGDAIREKDIDDCLARGEFIRTHILRPTWHYVSAADYRWMHALCREKLITVYKGYCKDIGVDLDLVKSSYRHVEKLLRDGQHKTAKQINVSLNDAGIIRNTEEVKRIISLMEVEGVVCSGRPAQREHTYALCDEHIPGSSTITREESLNKLAVIYFRSHGPATLEDFVWWSGMGIRDAKSAVRSASDVLIMEKIAGREFWLRNDAVDITEDKVGIQLLPPYDEFVVAYKDRTDMVSAEDHKKVMSPYGIFKPTIMAGGRIIGSWKLTASKGIEYSIFKGKPAQKEIKKSIGELASFYGLK